MSTTEKQKMLAGKIYNSRDPELLEMHHKARKLLSKLNTLDSRDLETRKAILSDLLGNISEGVWVESPFFCDYGENISLGENSLINMNCVLLDVNKITIGKNVLIAPAVQIYTATHPVNPDERLVKNPTKDQATFTTYGKPVTIGDNVWIGGNSTILPGVTIGNNVTIGAGSVVTKNIPDNTIAVGNPCRIVKKV
ncbi:sugar O-acetyltransferase [Aquimarina hainanensis]|uniref:Acetyltransferase n=1 Tax=Aquimarina hainanensis TaxID=1578017 RepID=A0ABW5NCT0_9FLAO